jgi:hypothetical protein
MTGARIAKVIAVGLLAALGVWIARNTYWAEVSVPTPLKGEAARNPFYATQRFAEALGARAQWDRVLITPPQDAVVVLSAWHWSLSEGRRETLEDWVEAGGRLVVDASLVGGAEELEEWSGVSYDYVVADDDKSEQKPPQAPPLGAGLAENACRTLNADRNLGIDSLGPQYRVCGIDPLTVLTSKRKATWALRDSYGMQALRVDIGRGSVTVINASPFRYRELLEGDHGKLFVAATQLRRGDDIHFLSEDEHPSLLALSWQYGSPVVLLSLVLVALALWRGGARFGPLISEPELARRSLAEQIRGTGQFALRFGGGAALHAAAVRALSEAAQSRITNYGRLSNEERMQSLARLTGFEPDALASAINYTGARRSNELRSAIALLEAARRRTSIRHQRS